MTSDRGKEPSYEALWDLDLDDDPALALAPPKGPAEAEVRATQRDTLQPPVPDHEYVQAMMELGELDDPSDDNVHGRATTPLRIPTPLPPRPAPRDRDAGALAGKPGRFVMASEDELVAGQEEGGSPIPPRRAAPPPPRGPAKAAGFRTGNTRGAPVLPGVPAPRAPSIPPPPPDEPSDPLDVLDALESGALRAPLAPASPAPRRVGLSGGPSPRPGDLRQASPRPGTNAEPPSRPEPTSRPESTSRQGAVSSGPPAEVGRGTPALGAGLRFGPKGRATGSGAADDRITPVADDGAPASVAANVQEMRARFDAKNYGGALVLAESVLLADPTHAAARRTAESCREQLGEKYLRSLGGPLSVPQIAMGPDEIRALALDHRAGFLLSFIDGSMSIEEVLDVSSMGELEALRMMFELRQQGVIEIEEPPQRTGRRG